MAALGRRGLPTERLSQRMNEVNRADDTTILQDLFSWIPEEEHRNLCVDKDLLPVRRFFEPQWEYSLPKKSSRIERLSAHATEVLTRLTLPNDFLFKVDTASMKESLEVRVPMLDEDLFDFGLSLPYDCKVKGRQCKRVLRQVAMNRLPLAVANKAKRGFAIPVDSWAEPDFKRSLLDVLAPKSTGIAEFLSAISYMPMVESFADNKSCGLLSREQLYQRTIMLLSLHLSMKPA